MTAATGARPAVDPDVAVQTVAGDPLMDRVTAIYRQMLDAAGVEGAEVANPPQARPVGRTTFHVAVDRSGTVLGVLHSTFGSLDQLATAGLIDPDERLAEPICECPSIAVLPEAVGRGIAELLYRSVYCFARRQGARSLAVIVDPLSLDLLREDYGIHFRALGPVTRHLGYEQVAAGGELDGLEAAVRRLSPDFFSFLTEPFTDAERRQFDL